MSVQPSSAAGAESLGQVLIHRAFSKPPHQMVDSELIQALEGAKASDQEKVTGDEGTERPQVDVRV
jgi:hypothetical protein